VQLIATKKTLSKAVLNKKGAFVFVPSDPIIPVHINSMELRYVVSGFPPGTPLMAWSARSRSAPTSSSARSSPHGAARAALLPSCSTPTTTVMLPLPRLCASQGPRSVDWPLRFIVRAHTQRQVGAKRKAVARVILDDDDGHVAGAAAENPFLTPAELRYD
jgi:hypothetical protein